MPTSKQIRDFALVKGGHKRIEPPQKPTHGSLYLMGQLYEENKPFALLQYIRNKLIKEGYTKKQIKIVYYGK